MYEAGPDHLVLVASDRLRDVQLAMLRNERFSHPFYWASFIQSGAWTSLN